MNTSTHAPAPPSLQPLIDHYLPLVPGPEHPARHLGDSPHGWATDTVHAALLSTLGWASGTAEEILAAADRRLAALEAALPEWVDAILRFEHETAPGWQALCQLLEEDVYDPAEQGMEEFLTRYAPSRSGVLAEADRMLHQELRAWLWDGADLQDMSDGMGQLRWALRGVQPMVRTYRLAVAKYRLDTTRENGPDAELHFARQLQEIFQLRADQVPWTKHRQVDLPVYEYPEHSDPDCRMWYDPHLKLKITLALLLHQLLQPPVIGPDTWSMANPYKRTTDHPGLVLYHHALALEHLTDQTPLT